KKRIKSLLGSVLIITLPLTLLSAALLGLVYGYRVGTEPSLFGESSKAYGNAFVLFNYPATRLMFSASFLSTLSPMLRSFIMTLWGLLVARNMRSSSVGCWYDHLPTPYQLSLIVGITLASTERLRRYYAYLCSRSRSSIPPVMHHAAMMFTTSLVLALF